MRQSNHYKLTIKGKSQTVVVPVAIASQCATQTFDGALSIRRSQFDVGTGAWRDTSVVAADVAIEFHIVASKSNAKYQNAVFLF